MSRLTNNDPKFSDRLVWENSVDPDQTAPDLDEQFTQIKCNKSDKNKWLNMPWLLTWDQAIQADNFSLTIYLRL